MLSLTLSKAVLPDWAFKGFFFSLYDELTYVLQSTKNKKYRFLSTHWIRSEFILNDYTETNKRTFTGHRFSSQDTQLS